MSVPDLTKFIIVYFDTDYREPTLIPGYPNKVGLVPIRNITAKCYTKPTKVGVDFEEHT